jgi:hypothetical protein
LGTWTDGENPGAGSQSVDNTGLNGNFLKIDAAVGAEHNANGTHKNDVIKGANLTGGSGADRVVDNSTLETTAATGAKQIRQKDDGTTGAKLNANVVDNVTLEVSAATGSKFLRVKANGIRAGALLGSGSGKIVDGTSINLNAGNELEVPDAGITAAKLGAQSVTPAKLQYQEIIFLLNQAGTGAPVAVTVTDNYYGSPITYTFARTGTGTYTLTASAAIFAANKTVIMPHPCQHASYGHGILVGVRISTTVINLYTFRGDTDAASDTVMADQVLMIRVYP